MTKEGKKPKEIHERLVAVSNEEAAQSTKWNFQASNNQFTSKDNRGDLIPRIIE